MTARLFNMKSLILSGVFLFFAVCNISRAARPSDVELALFSSCTVTGTLSVQSINIKGGKFTQGQEIQTVTAPFSYRCSTYKDFGFTYQANLSPRNVKIMMDALRAAGLAMDITVQEGGGTPVTFTWRYLLSNLDGGGKKPVNFGQPLEPNKTYNLSGNITLRIFVDNNFNNTFLNIHVPESAFDLYPWQPLGGVPPASQLSLLRIPAFNIRFIPDNSGRVIISPSVVNLGHFYTEYKDTMVAREAPFTVTAQQNIGTQSPFVAPLAIEFKTNDVTSADFDTSVTLKNTKGEANGFRLSVVDDSGKLVHFNKQADMGNINLGNASGGKIIKNYKAKVEPIPGAEIKTGNFSAAMTVVVTYI
ncbi:fimbrial protein [Salmonella enterica]|nr:fimbrial protein [Salmonella enterica]EHF6859859.1 fimbrial protein [Salmonella enterica subsp. enterica serovar Panama]